MEGFENGYVKGVVIGVGVVLLVVEFGVGWRWSESL